MSPSLLNVLVLGAGELGMSVLRSFSENPDPSRQVSVLLRGSTIDSDDPCKRRDVAQLRAWGVALVAGDIALMSTHDLATLLAPFDLVISCTGFSAGRGTQVKIAEAVLAAGVKRFVPWQFGVDYDRIGFGSGQDLFDEQLRVRQLLRSPSNVSTEHLIISTGMFSSFLFEPWFGIVEPTGSNNEVTVRALGSWENAVTVTAAEDIGKLTVALTTASQPSTEWNNVVFVAGDTVTYAELAGLVKERLGEDKVHTQEWALDDLRHALAADPTSETKKYRVVFGEGVGVSWDKSTAWNAVHKVPTASLRDWIESHPEVLP